MSDPVTIFASIRARAGSSGALGERLLALVGPSRGDPGCITYQVHRGLQDPELWVVYEIWASQADLEAHLRTPHLQAFVAETATLREGDIDMKLTSLVSGPA